MGSDLLELHASVTLDSVAGLLFLPWTSSDRPDQEDPAEDLQACV